MEVINIAGETAGQCKVRAAIVTSPVQSSVFNSSQTVLLVLMVLNSPSSPGQRGHSNTANAKASYKI